MTVRYRMNDLNEWLDGLPATEDALGLDESDIPDLVGDPVFIESVKKEAMKMGIVVDDNSGQTCKTEGKAK